MVLRSPCLLFKSETCSCFKMKTQYSMDSKLFVFKGTVKAWRSEYVQNSRTTVCTSYKVIKPAVVTHYKLVKTTVCTCYNVIKSAVGTHFKPIKTTVSTCYQIIKSALCTHYKLITSITTVCTCYKVINSTVGTQSHSPSVSSFALQLVFFPPITSHIITIFFFHIQILWIVPHL